MITTNKTYGFTFLVDGIADITEGDSANALYEAGCDDATIGMSNGRAFIHFDREAGSFLDAIVSARADIQRANLGLEVIGLDNVDMVSQAQIADNIGKSRQYVHQLVQGAKGPGNFPSPTRNLGSDKQLWSWLEVADWMHDNGMMNDDDHQQAVLSSIINTFLLQRRQQNLAPEMYKAIEATLF